MKTPLLVEQHFHGCFGVDFNKASVEEVLEVCEKLLKYGIGYIFPTIVTDSIENTKRQIAIIKEASAKLTPQMARICGIHLEGIFLNPLKKGIHNEEHFLALTIENYKLIEDEFIKIVTLAPELDNGLIDYLKTKNIKVQAGHCVGGNLKGCNATTHTFNAMSGISHRGQSTALSALVDDNIYTEVIADEIHVSDEALRLLFKTKPTDKILLVSDSLPCAKSKITEFVFADETIYFDGIKATSKDGTIAGSTNLLPDIIKILAQKNMLDSQYITNSYKYHNLEQYGEIEWDSDFNIQNIILTK